MKTATEVTQMLNDRIKEARIKAGLTQKQLAEKVSIATTTLSGYERGASDPDINTLCKLMDVVGVDANFIYQDYNKEDTKKSPAPEGTEDEEVKVQEVVKGLTRLLMQAGWIAPGADLTDAQLRTIASYVIALNFYFKENSDL